MKPHHIPRDPPPSIPMVLITLMALVGACLGMAALIAQGMRWWRG